MLWRLSVFVKIRMAVDLEKAIEATKRRLRRIQRADKKTKKRYLIGFSFIAMILVIGLWFFYLNLTLPKPQRSEVTFSPAVENKGSDSFFKTLGQGFKNIGQDLKQQFMKFKEEIVQGFDFVSKEIKRTKEFTLEGEEADFVFEEEPLPPTPLP